MKTYAGLLMLTAAIAVSSPGNAAPRSGFEWGHYDSALYAYSKHPERLPQFEEALRAAIARGNANHRLAPGLQAELGYCLLADGKKSEANELFKAEMTSFPESREFMEKIMGGGAGQ